MPINLQNHRTSNAKLFSVSGNKQKLHTAASFQKKKNANLKVGKSSSGTGSALLNRMINNQSLAAAASNPSRRRHSMTGNSGINGSTHSATGSTTSGREGSVSPLRRSVGDAPSPPQQQQPPHIGQVAITPKGSSHERKIKKSASGDTSLDPPHLFRSSSTSSNKKKNMRRSRSFDKEKTLSSLMPSAIVTCSLAMKPRNFLRRGSGDSARSNNTAPPSANTNTTNTSTSSKKGRSTSTGALPDCEPESPRDTLKAKRRQLRRNTLSGDLPFVPDTPPSSLLNISTDDPEDVSNRFLSDDDDSDDDSLFSMSEEH
ncbi:expressed unknown protein [Seminavis robusta]|uniref:Uncharacterized protein n=1 Tax=Seminavis robusta TaxID=568900 RepID=A0A9N8D4K7_9STRA|nr:expressed unknown protein [Seminavis robusta]|eukprot:Sro3_g002690.1 n/a (315) ;mRNA; f:218695-219639